MYEVTDGYREAMGKPVQRHRVRGTCGHVGFTEDNILSGSFSISGQCSDSSMVQIGQVYTSELKATFLNSTRLTRYMVKGAEIEASFGMMADTGEYDYIPLGVFTVSKASWASSGVEVTAYDNMSKLDRKFDTRKMSGKPYELMELACHSCGLEFGMRPADFDSFANGTRTLKLYADNDIGTWRDFVSWVAQAVACNAFADRRGRIVLRAYNQDPVDTIDTAGRLNGSTFDDFETRYTGLSVVSISDQKTSYYSLEEDDALTYNLGSNPFLQEADGGTVEDMCREILSAMQQICYVPFSVEMIGNPAYDLMDCFVFEGGFADGGKVSCMTKYTFRYNGKYSCAGVGSDPALATANSKSDKNIAGLMEAVSSITSSINRLIYDYNTGPITVGQDEQTMGMLNYFISEKADLEGHFLMHYTASEPTRLVVRIYDQVTEELYSPLEYDIHEGDGTIGIPHAYLGRDIGIHSVYVTAQVLSGEMLVDTRGAFFSIDAGNFAQAVDDIPMDVRDITMRQLLESNGPDQIWIAGIEDGKMLSSYREYQESYSKPPVWTGAYTPGAALDAAIEFDGTWVLREGEDKYTIETEDQPWYFWITPDHKLWGQPGDNEPNRIELADDVIKVSACKGYSSNIYPEQDQGLICAYIKSNGGVYYRQYIRNAAGEGRQWMNEVQIESGEAWDDIRVHRLNDYRVSFVLSNSTHNVWLISGRTYVARSVLPERPNVYIDGTPLCCWLTPQEHAMFSGTAVISDYSSVAEPQERYDMTFAWASTVRLYEQTLDSFKNCITVTVRGEEVRREDFRVRMEGNVISVILDEPVWGTVRISWNEFNMILDLDDGRAVFNMTTSHSYTWEVSRTKSAALKEKGAITLDGTAEIEATPVEKLKVYEKEQASVTLDGTAVQEVRAVIYYRNTLETETPEATLDGTATFVIHDKSDQPI